MNPAKFRLLWRLAAVLILLLVHCRAQKAPDEGLALKYLVQLPSEKSDHPPVVILLHGYGSNEADLFELREAFPKNFLIVSARAPLTLDEGAYQWYRRTNGKSSATGGNVEDIAASVARIKRFIAEIVAKYHADPARVYLIGFSQGAVMCYEVGLTSPELLTGIGVLSGVLYPSMKPLIKPTPALQNLRIFIGHGTADDRIPYPSAKNAEAYLRALPLAPSFHSYPGMTHEIGREEMADLIRWIEER